MIGVCIRNMRFNGRKTTNQPDKKEKENNTNSKYGFCVLFYMIESS
jgi:hypothetical protein